MSELGYLRIWTDQDGESHFEDVILEAIESSSGVSSARSLYADLIPVEGVIFREVVREHGSAEAHPAPRSQFVVHLEGEVEVEVSDGEVRRVGPETVVLVDDVDGNGHITRSVGPVPRRTLMIPLQEPPGADPIIGTWRLQTWRAVAAEDERIVDEPFGPDPVGFITFTPEGTMHGQMMAEARPPFSVPRTTAVEFGAGEPEEVVAAFNTYLGYSGRFAVDDSEGRLVTRVECASIPDWVGTNQERTFVIEGEKLTIRSPNRFVDGIEQFGLLKFTRI